MSLCTIAITLSLCRDVLPGSRLKVLGALAWGLIGGIVTSYVSPTSHVDARLAVSSFVVAAFAVTRGHPFDMTPPSVHTQRRRSKRAGTIGDRQAMAMIVLALVVYFGTAWVLEV